MTPPSPTSETPGPPLVAAPPGTDDRVFTSRFFLMCGFTFTVFLSLFQLLPTIPFFILDLGGSTTVAGFFLGVLTFGSALTAPVTGALADRIVPRPGGRHQGSRYFFAAAVWNSSSFFNDPAAASS